MKDSWIQSTLTQDQFQKIDRWIYTFIQQSGNPDPLKDLDYCVLVRKSSGLNREVIFSPGCFHQLSQMYPEFLALNTKEISKPALSEVRNDKQSFIYWFGNMHYFFKIFPPEVLPGE